MAYDGNGNWTYPAGSLGVSGQTIDSTKYNAVLADLQTALTKCLLRDGQSAALANIPMGGFKLTGLSAGSAASDSARYDQLATITALTALVSINGGQVAGNRNIIINGRADVSQRGTSFAAPTGYTLDRFQWSQVSTGVVTISQAADAPSGNEFQNSLRVTVTTADAAVAVGDVAVVQQPVEGFNVRSLIGRTFTLSFWVRSSKTGTHCVGFRNSGLDRSYVMEYSVIAANTWEYKQITVSGGLITAGTWNWTTGAGLYDSFALMGGTNFQTAANAWQIGNFLDTVNQVNCLDTNGNIFAVTGIQLEPGAIATSFEHRLYNTEFASCLRYCRVYPSGAILATGTNRTGGAAQYLVVPGALNMRINPIISYAGVLPSVYSGDSNGLLSSMTAQTNGDGSSNSAGAGAVGDGIVIIAGSVTTFNSEL